MKNFTKYLLLAVFAGAIVLLHGCSIKDPSDNFKLTIGGTFEQAIFDSIQTSAAGGIDTTICSNVTITGVSPVDETNAQGVFTVSMGTTLNYRLMNAQNSPIIASSAFDVSVENTSSNAVDFEIYIDTSGVQGTGIVNRTRAKWLSVTIPSLTNWRSISRSEPTATYHTSTFDFSAVRAGFVNRPLFVYFYVRGTPAANVRIPSCYFIVPPISEVIANVSPEDVADYTLEELSDIALDGRVIAGGGSVNEVDSVLVTFSCKAGTGTDTTRNGMITVGSAMARRTNYTTNGFRFTLAPISSEILSNTAGRTALINRFSALFPPTSEHSFFRVTTAVYHHNASRNVIVPVQLDNVRIVSYAQVRRR